LGLKEHPLVRWLAVFAIAAVIIAVRRYAQFLYPDVWDEDGTWVLSGFAAHGWVDFFMPVQGYLITASKIVSYAALKISFVHYAQVSMLLALAAQATCAATIATAPTALPYRFFAALTVVLIPTGAEVFLTPLYTFWWVGLFLLLSLVWQSGASFWPRLALTILAGLSSPIVIALAPLFVIRAVVRRAYRTEIVILAVVLLTSAIQVSLLLKMQRPSLLTISIAQPAIVVAKFLGTALTDDDVVHGTIFGLGVAALLVAGLWLLPRGQRLSYFLLGGALTVAVASSLSAVDVAAPHPLWAGPRYFFYPVIITLWMLSYLVAFTPKPSRFAAIALMGAYVPLLSKGLIGPAHIPLDWPQQVESCLTTDGPFTLKVQYWPQQPPWSVEISGPVCRMLQGRALW
jgi:hypothetical protein